MKLDLSEKQRVADEFLKSYMFVLYRLDSALNSLEKADSIQQSITGSIESMGLSSVNIDKLSNALSKIEEASSEIKELAEMFSDQYGKVEYYVTETQKRDIKAGRALRLSYIDCLTVKEIAEKLNCSKKTVYKHIKIGLNIVYDLI